MRCSGGGCRFLLAESEDIDNLQDGKRVKDKNTDEPRQLLVAGSSPQGYTLPWQRPENEQKDNQVQPHYCRPVV